jgi:hypothetical protein
MHQWLLCWRKLVFLCFTNVDLQKLLTWLFLIHVPINLERSAMEDIKIERWGYGKEGSLTRHSSFLSRVKVIERCVSLTQSLSLTRSTIQKMRTIKYLTRNMIKKWGMNYLCHDGEGMIWRCSLSLDWLLGVFMEESWLDLRFNANLGEMMPHSKNLWAADDNIFAMMGWIIWNFGSNFINSGILDN